MKNRKNKKKNTNKNKRVQKEHVKIPFDKPGNSLYPAPAVIVSCEDPDTGKSNLITVGWAGNICSDPAMLSISVRKERFSHSMIEKSGEFVVNLTTEKMAKATDYCGVKSGRDVDKWKETGLTADKSQIVSSPSIHQSPISIECKVREKLELGSHDMFIAEVVAVTADSAYFDKKGTFHLRDAEPIAYCHGKYYSLGKQLGYFGYSIRKKK